MTKTNKTILLVGLISILVALAIFGIQYIYDSSSLNEIKESLLKSVEAIVLVVVIALIGSTLTSLFVKKD